MACRPFALRAPFSSPSGGPRVHIQICASNSQLGPIDRAQMGFVGAEEFVELWRRDQVPASIACACPR
jgi:hypothetical protein